MDGANVLTTTQHSGAITGIFISICVGFIVYNVLSIYMLRKKKKNLITVMNLFAEITPPQDEENGEDDDYEISNRKWEESVESRRKRLIQELIEADNKKKNKTDNNQTKKNKEISNKTTKKVGILDGLFKKKVKKQDTSEKLKSELSQQNDKLNIEHQDMVKSDVISESDFEVSVDNGQVDIKRQRTRTIRNKKPSMISTLIDKLFKPHTKKIKKKKKQEGENDS